MLAGVGQCGTACAAPPPDNSRDGWRRAARSLHHGRGGGGERHVGLARSTRRPVRDSAGHRHSDRPQGCHPPIGAPTAFLGGRGLGGLGSVQAAPRADGGDAADGHPPASCRRRAQFARADLPAAVCPRCRCLARRAAAPPFAAVAGSGSAVRGAPVTSATGTVVAGRAPPALAEGPPPAAAPPAAAADPPQRLRRRPVSAGATAEVRRGPAAAATAAAADAQRAARTARWRGSARGGRGAAHARAALVDLVHRWRIAPNGGRIAVAATHASGALPLPPTGACVVGAGGAAPRRRRPPRRRRARRRGRRGQGESTASRPTAAARRLLPPRGARRDGAARAAGSTTRAFLRFAEGRPAGGAAAPAERRRRRRRRRQRHPTPPRRQRATRRRDSTEPLLPAAADAVAWRAPLARHAGDPPPPAPRPAPPLAPPPLGLRLAESAGGRGGRGLGWPSRPHGEPRVQQRAQQRPAEPERDAAAAAARGRRGRLRCGRAARCLLRPHRRPEPGGIFPHVVHPRPGGAVVAVRLRRVVVHRRRPGRGGGGGGRAEAAAAGAHERVAWKRPPPSPQPPLARPRSAPFAARRRRCRRPRSGSARRAAAARISSRREGCVADALPKRGGGASGHGEREREIARVAELSYPDDDDDDSGRGSGMHRGALWRRCSACVACCEEGRTYRASEEAAQMGTEGKRRRAWRGGREGRPSPKGDTGWRRHLRCHARSAGTRRAAAVGTARRPFGRRAAEDNRGERLRAAYGVAARVRASSLSLVAPPRRPPRGRRVGGPLKGVGGAFLEAGRRSTQGRGDRWTFARGLRHIPCRHARRAGAMMRSVGANRSAGYGRWSDSWAGAAEREARARGYSVTGTAERAARQTNVVLAVSLTRDHSRYSTRAQRGIAF